MLFQNRNGLYIGRCTLRLKHKRLDYFHHVHMYLDCRGVFWDNT